jgi:hypothetical protein
MTIETCDTRIYRAIDAKRHAAQVHATPVAQASTDTSTSSVVGFSPILCRCSLFSPANLKCVAVWTFEYKMVRKDDGTWEADASRRDHCLIVMGFPVQVYYNKKGIFFSRHPYVNWGYRAIATFDTGVCQRAIPNLSHCFHT